MKILFWDIDGTLMRTAKAGLFAFQEATRRLWQQEPDFALIHSGGMTDSSIAKQIIEHLTGRPASINEIRSLVTCYEGFLPAHLQARQGRLMPAVTENLEYFHDQPHTVSLLLTGNTCTGASIKLSHYGIDQYFNFQDSAFDAQSLNRLDIATQAITIATRQYRANLQDIYIIGDTPNDIRCGKEVGARTVAVATGNYSVADLAAHQPWKVLPQLPPPEEFAAML
ncbi:MAG TPA: HAD hydrolase-like protein [Patescibacteria group bacterium]|nr:HAD hydrolase-like protein [Patescibacteria group bacterium]